jgi:peptidyl-prolyl cis-trans isomerase A (cyclophilin A)
MVLNIRAPDSFLCLFETSIGYFEVLMTRKWSPNGVDRVYNLIRAGYYDDSRFYRVVNTWVVQFGVAGQPALAQALEHNTIENDPIDPNVHNDAGYLTFSAAYSASGNEAVNRTTELFINLENHRELDPLGFTPIGKVVSGFEEVVKKLYAGYGEMSDACDLHGFTPCNGPNTTDMYHKGNKWLDKPHNFPKLDHLISVSILEDDGSSSSKQSDSNTTFTVLWCSFLFIFLGFVYILKVEPWLRRKKFRLCCNRRSYDSLDAESQPVNNNNNNNNNNSTSSSSKSVKIKDEASTETLSKSTSEGKGKKKKSMARMESPNTNIDTETVSVSRLEEILKGNQKHKKLPTSDIELAEI